MKKIIFVGGIVHSIDKTTLDFYDHGAIVVDDGKIIKVQKKADLTQIENIKQFKVVELGEKQFLCPGLIDTHLHAPQFPNIGLGYDEELMQWLEKYTFPLEKKYGDIDFARQIYENVVKSTIAHGTTTACYYATIHIESAILLAKIIRDLGQRAIVGKVNMDRHSPTDYVETLDNSVSQTITFIEEVKKLNSRLVEPAVTPRFAPTCTMTLMTKLGEIAKEHGAYIQTHISENKGEIDFVKELFPNSENYTGVYNEAGLLTSKTILGHGVFLSKQEQKVIASKGTAIAHCPISNLALRSGICNVRELWKSNIKVGLGTDMSGGYSPSILGVVREAIDSSIFLNFEKKCEKPLTYSEGFFLATLGGAEALGKENEIGNFTEGKSFDALVVDMSTDSSQANGIFQFHQLKDLFQKFIYLGDDRNIIQVYVRGELVKVKS